MNCMTKIHIEAELGPVHRRWCPLIHVVGKNNSCFLSPRKTFSEKIMLEEAHIKSLKE